MAKKTMYAGINNSPQTTLTAQITAAAQSIAVASVDVFPAAPNLATIGTGDDAEVIQYNAISGGKLTGCVRGYGGTTAKVWSADTVIYRGFTLVDYSNLKDNVDDLYSAKLDKTGDASDVTAEFTAATARANIATGEALKTILGKIAKWFSDLKTVAISGSYNDLSDKPTSMTPAKHAASHKTGGTDAIAPADIGAQPKISTSGILKGDGSGNVTQAAAGTDFQGVIAASGILKGDGSGNVSAAVAGTDYAAASHTQAISSITGLETALNGKQPKKITQTNVSVATSAWVADSTYSDYPKAATVSISGVTAAMVPEVVFAPGDATSGNYAPVAVCVPNGVKIFAAEVPEAAITLLTIVVWG